MAIDSNFAISGSLFHEASFAFHGEAVDLWNERPTEALDATLKFKLRLDGVWETLFDLS